MEESISGQQVPLRIQAARWRFTLRFDPDRNDRDMLVLAVLGFAFSILIPSLLYGFRYGFR